MSHEGVEKVRGLGPKGLLSPRELAASQAIPDTKRSDGFQSGAIIFETKRWLNDKTEALA